MSKTILTIGFEIASDEVQYCQFNSDASLLDWDIILLKPDIYDFVDYSDTYNGKPSLSDSASFRLKEYVEHWRREIREAVGSGKTVIIYLSDLTEVYIDTGRREHSGTGRNRHTTTIVENYNNYQCIPAKFQPTKSRGKAIKVAPQFATQITSYWQEFEEFSSYTTIISGENIPACLVTKSGDKSVGAIYRSKNSNGSLLLLPEIDFYDDSFFEEKDDEKVWSKEGIKFTKRLISSVVALDKLLKSTSEITPEPDWAKIDDYQLDEEKKITSDLLRLESSLESLQNKKETLLDNLGDLSLLRGLLYESGKQLELAILKALEVLGFTVSQFDDGDSEFDSVFESKEGRLIGEAEGKDNKAINIDKLRQLALNIHEDLKINDTDLPAKSVLFGNPFRLKPIGDRNSPFTTKCLNASQVSSTALVFTPELFRVVHYLSNTNDKRFATKCRKVILETSGLVEFPVIPANKAPAPQKAGS